MSFSISKTLKSYQALTWSTVPLGGYIFFNKDLYRKMDLLGNSALSPHKLVAFSGATKFEEDKVIGPLDINEPCLTFSPSELHLEVSSVKNPAQVSGLSKGVIGFGVFKEGATKREWVICLENKSGNRVLVELETGAYKALLNSNNEQAWISKGLWIDVWTFGENPVIPGCLKIQRP